MMRRGSLACVGIAGVLVLAGCTSGGSTTKGAGDTAPATTAKPSASGPAPGVTSDSIKVGVTYVDTAALAKVGLHYDLGDWKGAYQALFDGINKAGGINGRKLVPTMVGVDPTGPQAAQAACVKLTEDDDVFAVVGFFLGDAVNCIVDTHATAVVGGTQNTQRLQGAKAPWVTTTPGAEQPKRVIDALDDAGALSGKVAVFAGQAEDGAVMNTDVLPALQAAGVKPVATAVMDAPLDDTAAIQNRVNLIAQKFQSSGADTVVLVGLAGSNWPTYMASNPYRPKLLFLDNTAVQTFASNKATTDTSVLNGSLAGGPYGPDQAIFDEAQMQACIAKLTAAGIKTPPPSQFSGDPSNEPYQAAFNVCPGVVLLHTLLQAAGKNLNYGTLATAIDGLKVNVPGDPTPRVYGPDALDGNAHAYLFAWDEASKKLVLKAGNG